MVSEHTIVNIRAHDSPSGDPFDDTSENRSARAKSRSTRVEYHSDRDRGSVAPSNENRNEDRPKSVYHSVKQPIIKAERGV